MPGWTMNVNSTINPVSTISTCPAAEHRQCFVGEAEAFDMHLPYSGHNKTITVPTLPSDANSYSYASTHALISIPAACEAQFGNKLMQRELCQTEGSRLRMALLISISAIWKEVLRLWQ